MRATENVVYMVLELRELSSIVIGFSFDCAVIYLEHI